MTYAIKAANKPPIGHDIITGKSSPPKYPVFACSIASIAFIGESMIYLIKK